MSACLPRRPVVAQVRHRLGSASVGEEQPAAIERAADNGMVTRRPLPPIAAVVSFIDRINHGDVPGLADLMTDDHRLVVLDEVPVVGREANRTAWQGYASAYPDYVIYPHEIVERDGRVAVVGHTTGSHLGLPDEDETRLTVIWLAEVRAGRLASWQIVQDTPAARDGFGLISP